MAPRTPIAQPVDQSTAGAIARTSGDLRLALDVVAGPDVPDSTAYRLALPPARHAKLEHYRVLVLDEHPMAATASDIRKAIADLAGGLEKKGCKVGRAAREIPDMKDQTRAFSALLMAMMGADTPDDDYATAAARAKRSDGSALDQSLTMSHRDWILLDRHRLALHAQWRRTFEHWDIVVCPVAPVTAFPHDARPFDKRRLDVDGSQVAYETISFWSALAAVGGLPVTTVPTVQDSAGLPIGVQLIGPRLEDYTTLAFADLLESELGCRFTEPALKAPSPR
jgi:amidase